MSTSPKTIGLLGGIASGKTTVAEMLGELGAAVIDADQLAHDVLRDPQVAAQVRRHWGERAFDAAGRADRDKLAGVVFQKRGEIEKLNAVVHPGVIEKARSQMEHARRRGAAAVVLDAALLIEAGMRRVCDLLIFIDTPAARRQELAKAARGWSAHEVALRESFQTSLDQKRDMADYVVHNDGARRELLEQIKAIWRREIGS